MLNKLIGTAIAVICAVATPATAQTVQRKQAAPSAVAETPNRVRGDEISPQQQQSVEKGLAWLASAQAPDGSFGGGSLGRHAGITALAGLAFMQGGNLPGRGKYGEQVQKALDFVLASSQESGLITSDVGAGPMYGHGFATLFLGEIYGMTGNEQVKEKLQRAVTLIEKSQNEQGGWRYQPVPYDADISVTICQVMALRAARDAGIKVQKDVIDKSIAYVRASQNADGGFSYMNNRGPSAFPRSAAGVASLYYAGIFEGEELTNGLKYIQGFVPGGEAALSRAGGDSHFYYGHYYAVQAMFLAGGEYWAGWYPRVRDDLIKRQDARSGVWNSSVSPDYSTAMSLIILQMPNRYLPVYTGKGPGS